MLEFLQASGPPAKFSILDVLGRLVAAVLLGGIVAWIYKRTRKSTEIVASFPTTLVLLAALIAMVTQVIGDNVARAFSLVGALSIVRFRTVVRDTRDTAFVIFSVVVGMAVGAQNIWVALGGVVVVGLAAFVMSRWSPTAATEEPIYTLKLRLSIGHDASALEQTLKQHVAARDLISIATARQGVSLDVSHEVRFIGNHSPPDLVLSLNKVEGVQNVECERRREED